MNLKICYLKIDVSCEASVNFHHISQNDACHGICTLSPLDDSQNTRNTTRLKCCACHAKCRWTRPKCCACHTKRLSTRCKHVWKSRSATPATRNEATPHVKPPKATPFAELTIGMAIGPSREQLRTVADGCGRLWATSSEHTLNPQTPRVKREPLLRIREKPPCIHARQWAGASCDRLKIIDSAVCNFLMKPSCDESRSSDAQDLAPIFELHESHRSGIFIWRQRFKSFLTLLSSNWICPGHWTPTSEWGI